MSRAPRTDRQVIIVRIMALVCVLLALICAALALAWRAERDRAECWRAAAEFQLVPEGDCPS
jgi:hypothetical protein